MWRRRCRSLDSSATRPNPLPIFVAWILREALAQVRKGRMSATKRDNAHACPRSTSSLRSVSRRLVVPVAMVLDPSLGGVAQILGCFGQPGGGFANTWREFVENATLVRPPMRRCASPASDGIACTRSRPAGTFASPRILARAPPVQCWRHSRYCRCWARHPMCVLMSVRLAEVRGIRSNVVFQCLLQVTPH